MLPDDVARRCCKLLNLGVTISGQQWMKRRIYRGLHPRSEDFAFPRRGIPCWLPAPEFCDFKIVSGGGTLFSGRWMPEEGRQVCRRARLLAWRRDSQAC